jgi:hypothetical protein
VKATRRSSFVPQIPLVDRRKLFTEKENVDRVVGPSPLSKVPDAPAK